MRRFGAFDVLKSNLLEQKLTLTNFGPAVGGAGQGVHLSRGRRINNPPQDAILPHEHQTCRYTGEAMRQKVVLSLDWWSVIAALAAAAIVKLGFLPHVPW